VCSSDLPYYDCSRQFVNKMDDILINYTNGQMALDIPFIDWSKKMVYKYCLDNKVPIQLTYSCENGTDIPCGRCSSCLDRGDLIGTS
jgi:7-cyano-7-deazaguanine synthase